MIRSELSSLASALIENISADFIFTPSTNLSKVASTPSMAPEATLPSQPKLTISDVVYRQKPVLKKRTKSAPLLPSQYKSFVQGCAKCKDVSERYAENLPETLPQSVYIMVITQSPLDEKGYFYTSKILSSISLDVASPTDVYITPFLKCKCSDKAASLENCFLNLVEEIKLTAPLSLLVFGKEACDIFIENGAESRVVWRSSIPIVLIDKMPLDLEGDISLKKVLWKELQKLRDYFMTI